MNEEIIKFISNRPDVIAAYGYGSGIFKQSGYTKKDKPQLDLILVVDNLKKWHLENMKENKNDYSIIGSLFFKNADIKTLKGSTDITYLSNIKENDNTFKYGTIEKDDLIRHLINWDSFFIPGRFQKVIAPIKNDETINRYIEENRKNALILSAFLADTLYPSKKELFKQICTLSYLGDTRMLFAENPKKIDNIVSGAYDEFLKIYEFNIPFFKIVDDDYVKINKNRISNYVKYKNNLPKYLNYNINYREETDEKIKQKIINYFTILNRNESLEQTLKGIETNGLIKSLDYGAKKLSKRFKR